MEHAFTKKVLHLTVLVEFVVSAGIGIYFHWVLQWEKEAYVVLATGMLLTLATYLVLEEIARSRDLVLARYQSSHSLLTALSLIEDRECQERAHGLLVTTERTLELLRKGYVPLDETEFYLAGAEAMAQSQHKVQAVDPLTLGWDSKGALRNYYLANLRALERGVRITRVFVIRHAELAEPTTQRVLQTQLASGIDVHLAFVEELNVRAGEGGAWPPQASWDFAVYDGRSVTERVGPSGSHFGHKTQRASEVARYRRLFEIIAHNAHPVILQEGRVAPAALAIAEQIAARDAVGRQAYMACC